MITNLQNFIVEITPDDTSTYKYTIDSHSNLEYNFIALQHILFPKIAYNIDEDFDITIDGNTISFYYGDVSFSDIISKINSINDDITCVEYLQNGFQESGKIQISKALEAEFDIDIPENYKRLFGFLTWNSGLNSYVSSKICDLNDNQIISIRCNAVSQEFKTNNRFDILQQISTTNAILGQYIEKEYDILNNKRGFKKIKELTFLFEDQDNNNITFNSSARIIMSITIFKYEYKFVNQIYLQLFELNRAFQIQHFSNEIYRNKYEKDEEEEL